ncbi:MAG: hypothetical protein ACLTGV_11450 [Butyricicoccus sp.]
MSRETNMTVGRPTKLILGLAVPLILTNVGQQLHTSQTHPSSDAVSVWRRWPHSARPTGCTGWCYGPCRP